jgi:hypothetical protein
MSAMRILRKLSRSSKTMRYYASDEKVFALHILDPCLLSLSGSAVVAHESGTSLLQ